MALAKNQIVHWRLKNKKINGSEFAKFVMDIHLSFREYTLIMDNHPIHKNKDIRGMAGRLNIKILYLPPQGADLNLAIPFFEDLKIKLLPRLR